MNYLCPYWPVNRLCTDAFKCVLAVNVCVEVNEVCEFALGFALGHG